MSKSNPFARGARRRFVCHRRALRVRGGIPGDAVAQVSGTPITEDDLQPLDGGRRLLERGDAPATHQAGRAGTAQLHRLHRAPRSDRAETGQRVRQRRPPQQLKTQCEQQYKSLKQEVLGFLISSQLGARRRPRRRA